MEQWEYKKLTFGPNGPHDNGEERQQLEQEGLKGWELVSIDRAGLDAMFYLKRRREISAVRTRSR